MIYLNVSFDQKDIAKSMGARWDPEKKLWYAPDDSFKELIETFGSLTSRKKLKVNINKKDTNEISKSNINRTFLKLNNNSFKNTLCVDLVPKKNNLGFYSLKANLNNNDYYEIKNLITRGNGYKCSLCDFSCIDNEKTKLNLCERWSYSLEDKKQKLEKIIGICDKCLTTTRLRDKYLALEHLVNINGFDQETAKKHIFNAFEQWKKYNEIEWTLDISLLTESGYFLKDTHNKLNSDNIGNLNDNVNTNNVNTDKASENNVKKIKISKIISTSSALKVKPKEKFSDESCLIDFDSD